MPTKDYIVMLDIAAIVRRWKDIEISDRKAREEIDKISIARQKEMWNEVTKHNRPPLGS